jgi:hypothetical protein
MNVLVIISGVVLIIVIYLAYVYLFRDKTRTYLLKSHNAKKKEIISTDSLSDGVDSDFTISLWMYVNSWNYRNGKDKQVLLRGNSTANSLQLILGASLNDLTTNIATTKGETKCSINNVPLQKWFNVVLALNNRALDLYLDGKLVRTCMLSGVLSQTYDEKITLTPGGGFDGHISNLVYYSRAINPRNAYAIYRDGPGSGYGILSSMFNRYKIKIAFLENEREVSSLQL